ncbi:EF hand domain-containing protein [Roseimicrobium gellanilyticum]|uniref:EF hand domain-containing protein n=1 Tax=Roseimicrobium gellanilyticum TaxID=748857 RepID=A0A366HN92_9BACT|nr:EF-hand domain-containing protein [Roseimicrobium gellanilyticum]RBP43691.1 EF hand domain-containing protein [Roseimicrobium gellanilyticum]
MKIILTLGAMLLSATLALAAEGDKPGKPPGGGDRPRGNPEEFFKKLDTNSDGAISKEEYLASPRAKENAERAEKGFAAKDKDKDGKLTKEEFLARPEGGRKPGEGGDRPGKKPEGDKKP